MCIFCQAHQLVANEAQMAQRRSKRPRSLSDGSSASLCDWLTTFIGWDANLREEALYAVLSSVPKDMCRKLVDFGTGRLQQDIIFKLPVAVAERALSWLNMFDLSVARSVSLSWRKVASAEPLWRGVFSDRWLDSSFLCNARPMWHHSWLRLSIEYSRNFGRWSDALIRHADKRPHLGATGDAALHDSMQITSCSLPLRKLHTDRVRHVLLRGGCFITAGWDGTATFCRVRRARWVSRACDDDVNDGSASACPSPAIKFRGCVRQPPGMGKDRGGNSSSNHHENNNSKLPCPHSSFLPDARAPQRLCGHSGPVYGVWTDGIVLLTSSEDRTVRVWLLNGSPAWCHGVLRGHAGPVFRVTVVPNARAAAVSSITPHHDASNRNTSRLRTGSRAGSSSNSGSRSRSPSKIATLDGMVAASVSADGTARLWDMASCTQLTVLRAHTADVHRLLAGRSGAATLVTGSYDTTARVWHLNEVLPLPDDIGGHGDASTGTTAEKKVSGGKVEDIKAIEAEVQQMRRCVSRSLTLSGHRGGVSEMCLYGDTLATGSAHGDVYLWDICNGCQTHQLTSEGEQWHASTLVTSIAMHERLVIAAHMAKEYAAGMLTVWHMKSGLRLLCISSTSYINAIQCEHGLIYCACSDGYLRVWSARAVAAKCTDVHTSRSPARSKGDSRQCAATSAIVRPEFGNDLLGELRAHDAAVVGLDVQGSWAATCSVDHTVRLWHVVELGGSANCNESAPAPGVVPEMPAPWGTAPASSGTDCVPSPLTSTMETQQQGQPAMHPRDVLQENGRSSAVWQPFNS